MTKKLYKLTPEQEELIPFYRNKWRRIALSSEPIARDRAKEAIKEAYATMGKAEPEILFFPSPIALAEMMAEQDPQELARRWGAPWPVTLQDRLYNSIQNGLEDKLWEQLKDKFADEVMLLWQLKLSVTDNLRHTMVWGQMLAEWNKEEDENNWQLYQEALRKKFRELPGGDVVLAMGDVFWRQMGESLTKQMEETFWNPLENVLPLGEWQQDRKHEFIEMLRFAGVKSAGKASCIRDLSINPEIIDFCVNILNCPYDRQAWNSFKTLVRECSSFILYENVCIICDRPTKLLLDGEDNFHAEGQTALEFSDGRRFYYYHGQRLSERYGRVHPEEWQPEWLLSETNDRTKRFFIEQMGYARLCQGLPTVSLDSWREYELLRIEAEDLDIEQIFILKMICPSTGKIHAVRVPPEITSAREAISWANWDIDPEEFGVET